MTIWEKANGWTVLIVDDEPDNIGVPEEILSFAGATVYTAEDGIQGLKVLETVTPTFVLLDLSMPNMDGWEMLKQVRANPRLKDVPVIALTAHAMRGDKERVFDAGFNGYISKPFFMDTFWEEINRCIGELV
jgi:CheY-like chemotaxis protein